MSLILYLIIFISLVVFSKLLWEHFLVYVYAKISFSNDIEKLRKNLKYSKNSWALVTGATDGIGKAYALMLSRIGFNIILIGRSPVKLSDTKEYILNDDKVKQNRATDIDWIDIGVLDFSVDGFEKVNEVINNLLIQNGSKRNLRILVNNAGVSYERSERFLDVPEGNKTCKNIVDVNILGTLNVTRSCLPFMVHEKDNISGLNNMVKNASKGGIVINLSSFSAVMPVPCLSVYAASKSFIWHLTSSLQSEYEDEGVYFQTVIPYFVVTKMTRLKRVTFLHPDPLTYVSESLKMVGLQNTTFGYWPHAMFGLIVKLTYFFFPRYMTAIALRISNKSMKTKKNYQAVSNGDSEKIKSN